MSFPWEFLRLQAAAEVGFASAVENLCFLPEWRNPFSMNRTHHGNPTHSAHSSWLALRYAPPTRSIASARALGPAMYDAPPLQPPGIPEGSDQPTLGINAKKASESSLLDTKCAAVCAANSSTTTIQEARAEEGTRQQELAILLSDARVAAQQLQDIMVANQQKTTSLLLVEQHLNWIRRLEIARQHQLQEQVEILMTSDHQVIGKPSNDFSFEDSCVPNLASLPSQLSPSSFETNAIIDGAPLIIDVISEQDDRTKEGKKKVEESQEATQRTGGRTKARTMRKVSGKWEHQYNKLVKYKERYGNTLVPRRYRDDLQLACWVDEQRKHYKLFNKSISTSLTPYRIGLLDDIGFVWNAHDDTWEKHFRELIAFKEEYGMTKNPTIHLPSHRKLGLWLRQQRRYHNLKKRGLSAQITEERILRLERIGCNFDIAVRYTWIERFEQLCKFKAMHGHFNVPPDYQEKLALWIENQRSQYKRRANDINRTTSMSSDRMEKLIEIGLLAVGEN